MDTSCAVHRHAADLRNSRKFDSANGGRCDDWQAKFIAWLPAIRRYARRRLWHLGHVACSDAVDEVVAAAFVAYRRLAERGRVETVYAGTLARYALAQQRAGRHVGTSVNVRDITSEACRLRKGVCLERIDRRGECAAWQAVVVEDRRAGPADVAATRIDFHDWLGSLSPRNRSVAEVLATGESTRCAARRFGLSPGRISQLRRELSEAWAQFTSAPAGIGAKVFC